MRHALTTWAAMALMMPALAQETGEIQGKVMDVSGEALPFCVVRATQGDRTLGAETDMDGHYVLKPLPAGHYTVSVTYPGHDIQEVEGVRVDPGLITRLPDIVLKAVLGTVVVHGHTWGEPLIRPDDPSRMVITASQIRKNVMRKDPVKLVVSMTPGITKSPNSEELYFRGSRAGSMAWYVDGVKVTGTDPGVPSDAISRISVYTGGLPAKYGDVTGGVVAIETKSYFDLYQQRNAVR